MALAAVWLMDCRHGRLDQDNKLGNTFQPGEK